MSTKPWPNRSNGPTWGVRWQLKPELNLRRAVLGYGAVPGVRPDLQASFLQRPHEDHRLIPPAPDRFPVDAHHVSRLLVGFAQDEQLNRIALLNRQRFRPERGLLWRFMVRASLHDCSSVGRRCR